MLSLSFLHVFRRMKHVKQILETSDKTIYRVSTTRKTAE